MLTNFLSKLGIISNNSPKTKIFQHLQIEISANCPGACAYCPRGIAGNKWQGGQMSYETFQKLESLLLHSERAHLQGWGEPLLHPKFCELVTFARKAGCAVSSTSCGLSMNKDLALQIVRSGMDILAFSLAGTDEKTNAIRHKIPLAKVKEAIAIMQEAKKSLNSKTPELRLAYLLLADRLEAVRALPELMQDWNIPTAIISTLDLIVLKEHKALSIAPHEQSKINYAKVLLSKIAKEASNYHKQIYYTLPQAKDQKCREHIEKSLSIAYNGNVAPCIYLNIPNQNLAEQNLSEQNFSNQRDTDYIFGNIKAKDGLEIWQEPKFQEFRDNLQSGKVNKVCEHCPKRFA